MSEPQSLPPFVIEGMTPMTVPTDDATYLSALDQAIKVIGPDQASPMFLDRIDDMSLASGLLEYCDKTGDSLQEYLENTIRFDKFGLPTDGETLALERHSHASNGREIVDVGEKVITAKLSDKGINIDKVLYFRVTQPATDGVKPETFWTSDLTEVYRGLRTEMGNRVNSAIILVATLGEIAKDSEIMTDVNEDSGHPIRRIADNPFSQSRAMFAMHRNERRRRSEGHFTPETSGQLKIPAPLNSEDVWVEFVDENKDIW